MYYHAVNRVCENCIGTWDNGSMPSTYYLTDTNGEHLSDGPLNGCSETDQARGALAADRHDDADVINAAVYGSIFYLRGATSGTLNCLCTGCAGNGAVFGLNVGSTSGRDDGFTIQNTAVYVDPSNTGHDDIVAVKLGPGSSSAGPPNNLNVADLSTVAHLADQIDAEWTKTDLQHATSTAGLPDNIFEGGGARICNRYVNGVEQVGQKLWPWPMQDRILAATTRAASPQHRHMMNVCNSTSCTRQLVTDPHQVANVMGDIVAMFGPIPPGCTEGDGDPNDPPPAPTVWRTDTEE
jgi:hypothetical protein